MVAARTKNLSKRYEHVSKANSTNLEIVAPVEEKHEIVSGADKDKMCEVSDRLYDTDNNWGFETILTGKKVAVSNARCKLWEEELICKKGGDAVPTTVVEVVELACGEK